jgi:DNA polymerase III subunit delta'
MLFQKIIGHDAIKKRLINSVQQNRISHAQLFLGKEGGGNLGLAIAYAQYISCENKQEEDSCGSCDSCIKFEKLIHPDLHFVFPVATNVDIKKSPISGNFLPQWREVILEDHYLSLANWQDKIETGNKQLFITKDESIDILKKLSLKAYESEYKIIIIWYPEKFNIASANKLLKLIEEPPQKTLFMLVAQDSEQIISTILSRTQLVKVGPINETELQNEIIGKYQLPEEEALTIARMSDGNFLETKKIIEHSGSEEFYQDLFMTWMRSAFKGNVTGLIEWTEEIAKVSFGREKQKQFLKYGLHLFRESLMNNYGADSLERRSQKETLFLKKFAPYIHGANCLDVIELFNDAIYHIERNANPKILFLDVSLKLTKFLRVSPPEEIV